jgi:hypothetical protein
MHDKTHARLQMAQSSRCALCTGLREAGSGCAGARRRATAIDLVQDATGSGRVTVAAQRCIGRQLVALSPLERSSEEIRL